MFFVQGYKQHRAFIITQGPMKSTSRDFWKMVFSRKCSAIVMLSELCEQGEVQFTSTGHMHFETCCFSGGVLPILARSKDTELWRV